MRRTLLPTLVMALLAGAAQAQPDMATDELDSPRRGRAADERPVGPLGLFFSPAGEPFRGPEGLRLWFEGADGDRDGAMTLAELRADHMRFFKVLDANSDGVVDGFENGAYETTIAPEITRTAFDGGGPAPGMRGVGPPSADGERGGKRIRMGGRGVTPRAGAGRFSLINEPQPVRGADADYSGKVTEAEWAAAARRRFERLDLDADGKLALATLPGVGGREPPGGAEAPRPEPAPFAAEGR